MNDFMLTNEEFNFIKNFIISSNFFNNYYYYRKIFF